MSYFFFNDTATTEIYTLSLHDALPICDAHRPAGQHDRADPDVPQRPRRHEVRRVVPRAPPRLVRHPRGERARDAPRDRKSTRLNSSHGYISYAVFCLKKKKNTQTHTNT